MYPASPRLAFEYQGLPGVECMCANTRVCIHTHTHTHTVSGLGSQLASA